MTTSIRLKEAIAQAAQQSSIQQNCRVEQLHQRFEKLADKGLVERPTYKLASSSSLPACLSR